MFSYSYPGADTLTVTITGEQPNRRYDASASNSLDFPIVTTDGSGNATILITGLTQDPRDESFNHFFVTVDDFDAPTVGSYCVSAASFVYGTAGEWPDAALEGWFWNAATFELSVEQIAVNSFDWLLQVNAPDGTSCVHLFPNHPGTSPPNGIENILTVDFGSGPQAPPAGSVAITYWSDTSSDFWWTARTTESILNPTPPAPNPGPRPGCTRCGSGLMGLSMRSA